MEPWAAGSMRSTPTTSTLDKVVGLCGPGRHLAKPDPTDRERDDDTRLESATIEHWGQAWREAMAGDLSARRPAPPQR